MGGKAEGWVRGEHPHAHPSVVVLQLVPVLMCQRDVIGVGGKSAPGMSRGMGMGLSSCKMGLPMVRAPQLPMGPPAEVMAVEILCGSS